MCYSANNICKQFGPRSGPTNGRAWSGSKLFDTDGIPEIFFENFDILKKKSMKKFPGGKDLGNK